MVTEGSKRQGFEACLDLIEDALSSARDLNHVKRKVRVIRDLVKEKNVESIKEELGLLDVQ